MTSQDGTFPLTRHSVVPAAPSDDPAARSLAIEAITVAYWRPVYKYVRMKSNVNSRELATVPSAESQEALRSLRAARTTKGQYQAQLRNQENVPSVLNPMGSSSLAKIRTG
jgi:hypothetical protein